MPLIPRHRSGMNVIFRNLFLAACLPAALASCGKKSSEPAEVPSSPAAAASASPAPSSPASVPTTPPAAPQPPLAPAKPHWSAEKVHVEIKRFNPDYKGDGQFEFDQGQPIAIALRAAAVKSLAFLDQIRGLLALDLSQTAVEDLSMLKGMPLVELYLEDTPVKDLSPLRGMQLQKLYLSRSPVRDIGPLEGMSFDELNLVETQVGDLTPLAKSQAIRMFWLTGSPVESIAALKNVQMESLTLHRTKVKDLSPLSANPLRRLHIGETPVEDLSPLKGMSLARLVFTPANIKAGIEAAKALPLQEVGTKFEDGANDLSRDPASFWQGLKAP